MKLIRGGLLSAGALLLLALSPATSSATYPGANGRIAFSGIFTVLPNGSGLQQLTSGGDPSWSADGRLIAFTRSDGEAVEVWTMHADGTHERQVTHGGVDKANPSFSLSGRRIVFSTAPYDREAAIFKIRPDGMKKRRIVGHLGPFATSPVFSPGGRRIAFEGAPNDARREGIWKVKPDGSHLRRLTNPRQHGPYFHDQLLDWRPDGERILFYRCEWGIHECDGGNWVMRRDGSREHPINHSGGEVYSPDGNRFAFASGDYDNVAHSHNCLDIYTMRLNGSDIRGLTHNCEGFNNGGPGGYAFDPSWQPMPPP
jgi:Tol biopolymer transport system component